MKIRLIGTEDEIASAIKKLESSFLIVSKSGLYPSRYSNMECRCYLEVKEKGDKDED